MRNLGQKTERRVLKKIGARRQPRSGGIPGFPNDGVKGRYLIEIKSTVQGSIGVKRKVVDDLEENAMTRDKIPALVLVFDFPEPGFYFSRAHGWMRVVKTSSWVAIPREDFQRLTKDWKKS